MRKSSRKNLYLVQAKTELPNHELASPVLVLILVVAAGAIGVALAVAKWK